MEIRSNLKGGNYDALIEVAKMMGSSSALLNLEVWGTKVNANLECKKVRLDEDNIRYAFDLTLYLPTHLVNEISQSEYKETIKLDGHDYYLGTVRVDPSHHLTPVVYIGKELWK